MDDEKSRRDVTKEAMTKLKLYASAVGERAKIGMAVLGLMRQRFVLKRSLTEQARKLGQRAYELRAGRGSMLASDDESARAILEMERLEHELEDVHSKLRQVKEEEL